MTEVCARTLEHQEAEVSSAGERVAGKLLRGGGIVLGLGR